MLRRVLTILGYLGVTTLVVGVTIGLVAYGNGYTYDLKTHSVAQTGLVIIRSTPGALQVVFGDKNTRKRTPYRAAFKPGSYDFSLKKDGFWPWQKRLTVVGGQVTLAQYAVLLPTKPKTTQLDAKPQIMAQSVSKDHRHMAYVVGGAAPAVYTLELAGNAKPVKLYTPKAATSTTPAETLSGVEWSDDASHLLIISDMGGQPVHRLASAGGGEPTDLTNQYRFNLTGLKFSASNWHQLYWVSPDGLRRLDVGSQTVSGVLAEKVSQFWIVPDRVLYVQQTDFGRSLWSLDGQGHHQELIPALAESDSYAVAYVNYRGQDELAVVPSKTQVGTVYSGIYGDNPVAKVVAHGVTAVNFSPDGHLLALTSPGAMSVYDLERSALDNKLTVYNVAGQPGQLSAQTWFDSFHLLMVRSGHLVWSEYDGANAHDLGMVVDGLPAYSTSDTRNIVELSPTATGTTITEIQVKQ
jgi:hypothetical protein